jgi:hypothetical protein
MKVDAKTILRLARTLTFRVLLIALLLIAFSAEVDAFEKDTHYLLTFGLSLGTCFDWNEAHLIASADYMLDANRTTVGEMNPFRRHNKRNWHAFGHDEERLNQLWFRTVGERNPDLRLIKLGQFFHFLQDWQAHHGYPVGLGHAFATITGRDPDSLARRQIRTGRMLQATLDHLGKMCAEMGRLPKGIQDSDIGLLSMLEGMQKAGLLVDLIETSNPRWRVPFGSLSRRGQKIFAENALQIEQYIYDYVQSQSAKNVPADFRPGDDKHGIPPPLRLHFDRQGNLTESLDREIATSKELELKDVEPADDAVELEKAERLAIGVGWSIRLTIRNSGDIRSQAGELRLMSVDALTERALGELTYQVPDLKPGQKYTIEGVIHTWRSAKEEMIVIDLDIDDLSTLNNQIWFMAKEDIEEMQEDLKMEGRPTDGGLKELPPADSVAFVGAPKLILHGEELLVAVITVRTNLSNPTYDLALPKVRLRHENKELSHESTLPMRAWSISVLAEGQRPAAKTVFNAKISEICEKAKLEISSPVLEFTVSADDKKARTSVELEDDLTRELRSICTNASSS